MSGIGWSYLHERGPSGNGDFIMSRKNHMVRVQNTQFPTHPQWIPIDVHSLRYSENFAPTFRHMYGDDQTTRIYAMSIVQFWSIPCEVPIGVWVRQSVRVLCVRDTEVHRK